MNGFAGKAKSKSGFGHSAGVGKCKISMVAQKSEGDSMQWDIV